MVFLKALKYLTLFMMLLCTVSTGLSIAQHSYFLAAINFLCVLVNFSSYNSVSKQIEQNKE